MYLTSLLFLKCKSWIFSTISNLRKWFKAYKQSLALLPTMNFHSLWPNFYSTPFFLFLTNTLSLVDDFLIKVWWLFISLLFHSKGTYTPAQPLFPSVPTFAIIPFPNSPETFLCDYNICLKKRKLQTANLNQELHFSFFFFFFFFFCFHYSGLTFMDEVSNTSKLSVNKKKKEKSPKNQKNKKKKQIKTCCLYKENKKRKKISLFVFILFRKCFRCFHKVMVLFS